MFGCYRKGGPITIFAPTNDAFKKLPEGTIPKLLSTPSDLKKILSMHIVSGAIAAQNLKDGNLTAADGSTLKIAIGDDKGKHKYLVLEKNYISFFSPI